MKKIVCTLLILVLLVSLAPAAYAAENGDDGIALALRNRYDIIFLDHMMPHKDGIETLKELKAAPGNPNHDTPMICLTANAISGAREKYLEAGGKIGDTVNLVLDSYGCCYAIWK